MKIINIWTLADQYENATLLHFRSIKYAIRVMWPELALALDELCKNEYLKNV